MKPSAEVLISQIRDQISVYQLSVSSDNKAHRYNINDRAEIFTIPLFKTLFGWNDLEDLNKSSNFPGLDLGDYSKRIAIQVTSEVTIDKVKATLSQVVERELYKDFDRIIIFMISQKQRTYSQKAIDRVCLGKIKFSGDKDILDLSELIKVVKLLSKQDLEKVLTLFQGETGYVEAIKASQPSVPNEAFVPDEPPFESGFVNLFSLNFPDKIYVADWNFTKKDLDTKLKNERKIAQLALEQKGIKFALDWVTFENQLVTFHDLTDDTNKLSQIIDSGTVTEIGTEEYYSNPAYKNKFAELLQKCLQQKLYRLGIQWQKDEKEYIFVPFRDETLREVTWIGKKKDTRTVYKQIPNLKDKEKVYCHEHFAFKSRFYCFANIWYLSITPDWFYSSDGYQRAWYVIEDKRKYKKQVEANANVATHVRFLYSFLSTNNPQHSQAEMFPDMQGTIYPYKHLWMREHLEVKGMPSLSDATWRPTSSEPNETDVEPLI